MHIKSKTFIVNGFAITFPPDLCMEVDFNKKEINIKRVAKETKPSISKFIVAHKELVAQGWWNESLTTKRKIPKEDDQTIRPHYHVFWHEQLEAILNNFYHTKLHIESINFSRIGVFQNLAIYSHGYRTIAPMKPRIGAAARMARVVINYHRSRKDSSEKIQNHCLGH